ncbi:hypothetical protein N7499_003476 [Penicillium canescens]|uniref:uncharacterized protein n=1 Tax=Penicillium canescens TaxID=5083 RepID=UPI0026E03348|nr:uncharacterized protein N7446_012401 [Penicillium canescens]KAJ6020182.1 hypothetical protein N7522_000257 [Penicillium canescens]KAJ6045537.1 hypothetical protein N7446_012401 [Penicillium canescens]KAJ6090762.1 hypothetical protein N7499_003476 [Penicillium canescens]KAJ6174951.1 hypothetical protein N7485_004756 [Penicillium canescens]
MQRCAVSSVYIIEAIKIIRIYPKNKRRTKIFFELLTVNAIFILMDITLVVLQYLDFYIAQTFVESFVYSIELKLEFAVLGTLVSIPHLHVTSEPISSGEEESIRSSRGKGVTIAAEHAEPEGPSTRLTTVAGVNSGGKTPNGKKEVDS